MLRALFYARFHPDRGPSILHQYPADHDLTTTSPDHDATSFAFSNLSSYIIPPYEVCNRPLSFGADAFRVLGFPVSLEDARYARNRFTFNVCFLLHEHADTRAWEPVVRKTARFFKSVEEDDGILQAEELIDSLRWAGEKAYPAQGVGVLFDLLRKMTEDLNAYGETCVTVNDAHVLNLRLVSPELRPAKVTAWDVPLPIRIDFCAQDLVLQRILPHLDGVRHIQRIAQLADVEVSLVKKAVRELLCHRRLLLLDLFHFQAAYTITPDFAHFVHDGAMLDECSAYVALSSYLPTPTALIALYRHLHPGVNLQGFCLTHRHSLATIDIRRFITFGVLKGFLRRIHKYPLSVAFQSGDSKVDDPSAQVVLRVEEARHKKAWRRAAHSSGWTIPPMQDHLNGDQSSTLDEANDQDKLAGLLDGNHCMDEIALVMQMSEKAAVKTLRDGRFGEVLFICK